MYFMKIHIKTAKFTNILKFYNNEMSKRREQLVQAQNYHKWNRNNARDEIKRLSKILRLAIKLNIPNPENRKESVLKTLITRKQKLKK